MSFQTYRYVLLIVAAATAYLYGFASDRYATESKVFVKSATPDIPTAMASPLTLPQAPGLQDAYRLRDFVKSADMLDILEKEVGVRAHFSSDNWDFFSRMSPDATKEEMLSYYQDHLEVIIDADSSSLSIETQGFTREFSETLNATIIRNAEKYINEISQGVARQEITFIESQLEEKRKELEVAQTNLLRFQNAEGVLDQTAVATSVQQTLILIDQQLDERQTQLKTMRRFMSEQAPQIVSILDEIAALQEQKKEIRETRVRDEDDNVAARAIEQKRLELRLEFAVDLYQRALGALEQKEIEASQKAKYLVVIQSPRIAQSAKYPDRLYNIATIFVILSIAYACGVMIIASVQEHRDV